MAPHGVKSGGCESLHQAASELNQVGLPVKMAYVFQEHNICNPYERYGLTSIDFADVLDDSSIAIVFPEIYRRYAVSFTKAAVFVWWLGLKMGLWDGLPFAQKIKWVFLYPARVVLKKEGYRTKADRRTLMFESLTNRKERKFKCDRHIFHAASSKYALDYIAPRAKHKARIVVSPISDTYLRCANSFDCSPREDIVLYNAKRSGLVIQQLRAILPHIAFVGLEGLSEEELIQYYKRAKIYADFGSFPGPERMPKEAVICGCAIITGTRGAAGNEFDVPIPQKYKVDSSLSLLEQAKVFSVLCADIFRHFDERVRDFEAYRDKVINLKRDMVDDWLLALSRSS